MEKRSEPLRVGIMLDGLSAPAWISQLLAQLNEDSRVSMVLVVVNAEARTSLTLAKVKRRLSGTLYRLYERLDRRIFRTSIDAFEMRDVAVLVDGATFIRARPERKGFVHRFDLATLDAVRKENLDVLLRFGFNILRGEILEVPRHGVWSYHHGDNRLFRGGPPFFWEMFERQPTTGVILQILTEDLDGGYVIYRSSSATDLTSLSRGRNAAYWKGSHFVARCLRDLYEDPLQFRESRRALQPSDPYKRGIYRTPTNLQMLHFLGKLTQHVLRRAVLKVLFKDQWCLGLRDRGAADTVESGAFRTVVPPRDRFYADPFVVSRGGSRQLLFEEFPYADGRGHISAAQLTPSGQVHHVGRVLSAPHHLSYPCVFQEGEHIYISPESYEAREIAVHRAIAFPRTWERFAVVRSDLAAVDPTIIKWEDRYWIFCNVAQAGMSPNDELHIFYASALDGPWYDHHRNPVVSDVTRARPGGRPFMHDGCLIRPAQDCSGMYGRVIRLQCIDRLGPAVYEEREVGIIGPDEANGATGIHTYDSSETLEVVDVRYARSRMRLRRPAHGHVRVNFELDLKR